MVRLFIILALTLFSALKGKAQFIITPPAGDLPTQINKQGTTVIPNGRMITPLGKQIIVAPHPYGLALSPDGNTLVTANSGTAPLSITLIRNYKSEKPEIQQIPPGASTEKGVLSSVFMGLAFSADSKTVYVSGGQENKIYQFESATGASKGFIDCSAENYTHGYIGDMTISKDGRYLFAVDQIGFRVIILDLQREEIISQIPVGRYPFGIALSRDEQKVFVANVGMYAYKTLDNLDPDKVSDMAMKFPLTDYLSVESEKGVYTDSVKLPGLGDPLSTEAFSVWTLDVSDLRKPRVLSKIKTGIQVGEKIDDIPAVGGSSPNSLVVTDQYVFVSNGNNDCISVLDTEKGTLIKNIFLNPEPRLGNLRGLIPFGLAISPDQKSLYVAEAGINAVAIVDIPTLSVKGHLPLGWFPSKLVVSLDGKQLIVSNAKGYGSGPNAGVNFTPGPEGSNIGRLMKGTVSILDIPSDDELGKYTQQVISNNFRFEAITPSSLAQRAKNPIPLLPNKKKSPIKYWVFIPKENRTYDEVLGQLEFGKGDATLARYGRNVPNISNRDNTRSADNVSVMPNHLALAERFAFADNFYCDGDHSADGHRWLAGTYPNEWVETSTSASYGGNRNMRANSKAPGNLAMVGSSSAIYPEDYNESGSIWDHFERNKVSYFNFGLGLGLAARLNGREFKPLGVKYLANYPLPAKLRENSSKDFPVYNTAIPDQYRADIFIKEVKERWLDKGKKLPSVITARIPNDHGAEERAEDGYPFRESYMADNDLAIGRVVEFLSHTRYWKKMAIVITEDDSQGGVDHIDAHRSILMVISPYSKQRYAGSVHYSFGSIFKTFWNSLGLPYLNQYDAGAADLSDLFTDKPDFRPYQALPVDARIFDPQKALTPINEKFNWQAMESGAEMDHPQQMLKDSEAFDKKKRKN